MKLGFVDQFSFKNDGYAYIYMEVPSIEYAESCHSSFRIMKVVEYDETDTKIEPNPAYYRFGSKDRSALKAVDWYKVTKVIGHV